ncbi:MAG: RNA polymerase sigma factor [Phycisphaerae bacterium]
MADRNESLDVDACFRAHRADVYRWAFGLTGSHADAADIVQETFVRLMQTPPRQVGVGRLAWLRRVATRVSIDRWRSMAAARRSLRVHSGLVTPEDQPERRDMLAAIHAAMETLSEQQRLVLIAKCYDGLTFEQIAAELGIATPTAKTHYLRALEAVRNKLGVREPGRARVASGSRS